MFKSCRYSAKLCTGVSIPGMDGRSMFKTPDDPMAKVGVVGAGRGMTDYKAKGRHIFES